MSDLIIAHNDLLRIKAALLEGRKLGGMRIMGRKQPLYGAYVEPYTLMGSGWTLYFSVVLGSAKDEEDEVGVTGLQLVGDRERFEEDFILGKMAT